MRNYGTLNPTDLTPNAADTVNTLLIAGSSGQAMDWPAGTGIARFTGVSTSGALLNFMVNLWSTIAAAPSSGQVTSSAGSTGYPSVPVNGRDIFQISGKSTGFSVAALSSG